MTRNLKIVILLLIFIMGLTISCGCMKRDVSQIPPTPLTNPTLVPTQPSSIQSNDTGFEKTEELAKIKLSLVKVASLYESVTDEASGDNFTTNTDEAIRLFNETDTDLIFRGFFRWQPVPESSDAPLFGYPGNYVSEKAGYGYTYKHWERPSIKSKQQSQIPCSLVQSQHNA